MNRPPAFITRRLAATVAALSISASAAHAQCADGTPPPCASQRAAAAKRVDPPLDERTWIIVPFDNLARATDVEWLREASVNLLYLDMSQWRDIRVIDDERAADLLRDAPEFRDARPLSLTTALNAAKRVGAGRLVMGDFLKAGPRTRITAKIFDVKSGTRVRSAQLDVPAVDSIMPAYGRLARDILSLPGGNVATSANVGTTRIDAYQEYVAGLQSLNRFDLDEARKRFLRAIQLDSAFALAHHKLAGTLAWIGTPDSSVRSHAAAAVRLGTRLPARERALIGATAAMSRSDYAAACETYTGLLVVDSLDVEALFGLGDCSFHDTNIEPLPNDTTRFQFRYSWNTSIKSFQKVLALDPSNHVAFQHIMDALVSLERDGCRRPDPHVPCPRGTQLYGALLRISGDSLLFEPVRAPQDTAALRRQFAERAAGNVRRKNLDRAMAIAESWVDAGPDEAEAHLMLGHIALLLGETQRADRELTRHGRASGSSGMMGVVLQDRLELAIKLGRGAEANGILDTMFTSSFAQTRLAGAIHGPTLGRFGPSDSIVRTLGARGMPPDMINLSIRLGRVIGGVLADDALAIEQQYLGALARAPGMTPAMIASAPTLLFALRLQRATWPTIEYGLPDRRAGLVVALSRGDTARVRRDAQALDSAMRHTMRGAEQDSAWAIIAADAYLLLRDSVAALTSLRVMLDSAVTTTSMTTIIPGAGGVLAGPMWTRAMLLRADLAAALGLRDEARAAYTRFLGLWSKADPEFAPVMTRVRAALASLGRS